MAKRTQPIGFGPQKSREGTIIYTFTKDESRPGFVSLNISGLTEDEALSLIPKLVKKK